MSDDPIKLSEAASSALEQLRAIAAQGGAIRIQPALVEEVDSYAEVGMLARLVSIGYSQKFEAYDIILNFEDFAEHNRPLETSDFWDNNGKATLTARQAGYYKEEENFYIDMERAFLFVEPADPLTTALHARFKESGEAGSYARWLEVQAARALGIAHDEATPKTPMPPA